ncbi:MAG: SIMPL domain-containing protein [Candidatus Eremiobacteraeota bacterium]|nr:SIMPL domain-containing protein [Candidatus Eremiobacteraeota bacterium]
MKFASLFLAASLAIVPSVGAAATPPTVTVTGQGSVAHAPDIATVSLGITVTQETAESATTQSNSRFNDLRNRLRALGLSDGDLTTTSYNFNFQPRPEQAQVQTGIRYGYTASRAIDVRIANLGIVGKVVDAAVGAGADVNGVNFSYSRPRELYAQALKAAVADALVQAQALAGAAHLRIVRVLSMDTGFAQRPVGVMMRAAMPAPAAIPTEIVPGTLTVQAEATVTYEVEP